ncbi:hypothetical protein NECAME_18238 [Necator americanus]|uniref:Internal scaffolding protein n=1 Tax=Necator americanus TaxID=51031 RepID=W2T991_NECAM|nr:hypothetical protein NECAME_18238 [Necator americanus]ETN78179.1 hypothetical protein NECAME_18238 [Necator americanus]
MVQSTIQRKHRETTQKKIIQDKENTLAQKLGDTMTKLQPDYLLRKVRPIINCDEPKITDQSDTPMTEINNIMKQYVQTGMLPGTSNHEMHFANDYERPEDYQILNAHRNAVENFELLPLKLRNELNNDYRNFETWINDPDNTERAIKLGLLVKKNSPSTLEAATTTKLNDDKTAQLNVEKVETSTKSI